MRRVDEVEIFIDNIEGDLHEKKDPEDNVCGDGYGGSGENLDKNSEVFEVAHEGLKVRDEDFKVTREDVNATDFESNQEEFRNELEILAKKGADVVDSTDDIFPWTMCEDEIRAVEGILQLPVKTKLPARLLWLATGSGLFMFFISFAILSYTMDPKMF